MRALQKTMMMALGLLASCKPSGDISSMKAVSAADGKIAYTIVPVRNFFDQSQTANVQSSPVSATLLQSLTIGAVRCEGATAKIDAVLLEMSLVNTGVTLLRKGSAVYQNNDDGPTLVNRCKLSGSYVGGAASVVSLLTGSPSFAKQAVYLGMRGPTTVETQTTSPFLYEFIRENLGVRFSGVKQYSQLSQELDVLYNPCLVDKSKTFDKFAKFSCEPDGHYVAKDINSANDAVTKFFETAETEHIKNARSSNQSAGQLYSQLVAISSVSEAAISDQKLDQTSLGTVFSGNRAEILSTRGWVAETAMTFGQTNGSPAGFENPRDEAAGWRRHGSDSYTKDGISFYYEKSPGKFQRIVHVEDGGLYKSAGKDKSPQLLTLVGQSGGEFALAGGADMGGSGTPQIDPSATPWAREQGPGIRGMFDSYRGGRMNGSQVTDQLSRVTSYLPFGRPDRGDPFTKTHNCVDIAMATCRAMYPLMGNGGTVGTATVSINKDGRPNGAHMINYFGMDNRRGSRDIVVYDQQSGAISKPHPSFEDALKDPGFSSRVSAGYGGTFKLDHAYRPDSVARVIPATINPSTVRPATITALPEVAARGLPRMLSGKLDVPPLQIGGSGLGSYTPSKPNYMWQGLPGNSVFSGIGRAFGGGFVKDGTHGAYKAPESAQWYSPMRSPSVVPNVIPQRNVLPANTIPTNRLPSSSSPSSPPVTRSPRNGGN